MSPVLTHNDLHYCRAGIIRFWKCSLSYQAERHLDSPTDRPRSLLFFFFFKSIHTKSSLRELHTDNQQPLVSLAF